MEMNALFVGSEEYLDRSYIPSLASRVNAVLVIDRGEKTLVPSYFQYTHVISERPLSEEVKEMIGGKNIIIPSESLDDKTIEEAFL